MAEYTLEERLAYATQKLDDATSAVARAVLLQHQAREMGGGLLSFGGSGSQRAAKQVRSATERGFRAYSKAQERYEYWERKVASYGRQIAERDREHLTRDDVAGALAIRDSLGWRKVVRVNAKSVTVVSKLLPTWTDLVPFEKVLEVRRG